MSTGHRTLTDRPLPVIVVCASLRGATPIHRELEARQGREDEKDGKNEKNGRAGMSSNRNRTQKHRDGNRIGGIAGAGQASRADLVRVKSSVAARLGMTPAERDRLDRALTEILSSAGVVSSRIAAEVLFLLPGSFLDVYEEAFEKALKAPITAPGEGQAQAGALGKAPGMTNAVRGTVSGVSGGGKKYKRIWVIADEDVLSLKERVDKKLRALGREMRDEMDDIEALRKGEERGKPAETKIFEKRCRCGRLVKRDANFCSHCGHDLRIGREVHDS